MQLLCPLRWLSLVLVARVSLSVKPCLDLERLRYDEPECETPRMTRSYCHNTTCSPSSSQDPSSKNDACDLVTHSFLAEFEVFDVVLIPASACQAGIKEGSFTYEDAKLVLPSNEELVYVRLLGRQLRNALVHGLNHESPEAQPKLAGVKFDSRILLHDRKHIFNIETLGSGCAWKALNDAKFYNVLTVESLVAGRFGYEFLPKGTVIETSGRASRMDRYLRDMFWTFTKNVCTLRDPFRKPVRAARPLKYDRKETVVIPGPCLMNSTNMI